VAIKGFNPRVGRKYVTFRSPSDADKSRDSVHGLSLPQAGAQRNNLDFLRVFAALLVILGHQYVLFGLDPPIILETAIHTWGLRIFFVISGWLVSRSWDRDPNFLRFISRRGLRILPALVVLIFLTTFVFGPLCTDNSATSYFKDPRTYEYLKNCAFYINYYLPGVFESNPVRYAVNGSLWSLPSEVSMYALVAATGMLLSQRLNGRLLWTGLFVLVAAMGYYLKSFYAGHPIVIYATLLSATMDVGIFFVAGTLLWKCNSLHKPRLSIGIIAIVTLCLGGANWSVSESFLFAYAVMAFGLASIPILNAITRCGDLSYGTYLYAFPIQQLSYQIFQARYGFWLPLSLSLVATVCCAFVSWHVVEQRALQVRPRGLNVAVGRCDLASAMAIHPSR
jgi:peptidoglycan/LPS O-acetylase OafA/YrhL